jgi:hypothetical protein
MNGYVPSKTNSSVHTLGWATFTSTFLTRSSRPGLFTNLYQEKTTDGNKVTNVPSRSALSDWCVFFQHQISHTTAILLSTCEPSTYEYTHYSFENAYGHSSFCLWQHWQLPECVTVVGYVWPPTGGTDETANVQHSLSHSMIFSKR